MRSRSRSRSKEHNRNQYRGGNEFRSKPGNFEKRKDSIKGEGEEANWKSNKDVDY